MIGISIKYPVGRINNLNNVKLRIIEKIPIKIAVAIERV